MSLPNRPGPGHNPAAQGKIRLDKNALKTLKRVLAYVGESYRTLFVFALICIALSALVSVASALFLRVLIDDYITPLLLSSTPDLSALARTIGKMGLLYASGILAALLYQLSMVTISHGVLKTIRNRMFSSMQHLPLQYFDTHAHGDVMSRYTNDTDAMRQMLSQSIPHVFSSLLTIVFVLAAMIALSPMLTILVLGMVAVIFQVTARIGGKSAEYFKRRQKVLGEVNGYVEEMINGQKVVQVFSREKAVKQTFDGKNHELFEQTAQANRYGIILMPILGNLGNLQYVMLAVVGGLLAMGEQSALTLGGLASFLTLSKNFSNPVSQISQQINSVVMALAGARRVFDLMDEAPEEDPGYVSLTKVIRKGDHLQESEGPNSLWAWKEMRPDGSLQLTELAGDIRLNGIHFAYETGKPVLHNIDLYAKPGQKIAFVGSTGAGKTTITNLINRFYDVQEGEILYDGIPIQHIRKPDLRRTLGMVLQDTSLFTGSILDNIRYGRPDATDEEVIEAAKLANAHGFISRLPQGYQTEISGTESELSQGQCQLISIARCAVADPPVMILDEATSSIDTRTERLIQKGMDRLMEGRTVFVIAHRLSTVQNAQAILVLEEGKIIERGDHDDLIAQKGKYYQLYTGVLSPTPHPGSS
ncbi:MAG: ABC transporter ATP-binding protein [Eubacteriales bacterium]|jgi:ATP-binding cassette subfamily B protein|nr:ABC transporter ATP-binding protein [Eubacteriales bacterium]MDD3863864.1 ABC transporter ATP-binding protein [Eubacteriales bacterium]MDD4444510.1 ABC transporter ATP-binding protein [Eubacteriales bacterium]